MLLLEQLERLVLADRHVVAVFLAAGAEGIELPTLQERRELFDASLVAAPEVIDSEQAELHRALGVA